MKIKKIALIGLFFIVILIGSSFLVKRYISKELYTLPNKELPVNNDTLIIENEAKKLRAYCKKNNYNDSLVFIINLKISSGKKRFFIYDFKNSKVYNTGLVTHGSGKKRTAAIEFSNTEGSLCSSLGKYQVGNSYTGKFGLAYKLHGLDESNSNAFTRAVVLHSHSCVPYNESHPLLICESWGCPTVSPEFLLELAEIINQSSKPILLDIIYE